MMKINLRKGAVGVGAIGVLLATPLVKYFEGDGETRPTPSGKIEYIAYLDPVDIATICHGITRINNQPVTLGMSVSREECSQLLDLELNASYSRVKARITVPVSETYLAAWTSFEYNVGPEAFRKSTALALINQGQLVPACHQLSRWVYAGGKKLRGLVSRREAEKQLCLKGVESGI